MYLIPSCPQLFLFVQIISGVYINSMQINQNIAQGEKKWFLWNLMYGTILIWGSKVSKIFCNKYYAKKLSKNWSSKRPNYFAILVGKTLVQMRWSPLGPTHRPRTCLWQPLSHGEARCFPLLARSPLTLRSDPGSVPHASVRQSNFEYYNFIKPIFPKGMMC